MTIVLPADAARIIRILEEAGHEAYVVGGCVRDSLMGRMPRDWDITTSALPQQVKALFRHTIDTGIKHGTVTVRLGQTSYEVTTYRLDGAYADHRHPDEVTFTGRLADDLERRDFTINAMAYNDRDGLVDLFGGRQDLETGIVRAVGDPMKRFDEDALRAVRFAAELSFSIEEGTREAICALAATIASVSGERIRDEMEKILCSANPGQVRDLWELGLTEVFFPEFNAMMETTQNNPHHCYTVGEHTLAALRASVRAETPSPADRRLLALTVLLHDSAKPLMKTTDEEGIDHFSGHPREGAALAERILRRWKEDNRTVVRVKNLITWHDLRPESDPVSVRETASRVGREDFPMLLCVMGCDVRGQSTYLQQEKLDRLARIKAEWQRICEAKEPVEIADLAVSGKDLTEAGIPAGPKIGEILRRMLEDVLKEPSHNTKEYLIDRYGRKEGERG